MISVVRLATPLKEDMEHLCSPFWKANSKVDFDSVVVPEPKNIIHLSQTMYNRPDIYETGG